MAEKENASDLMAGLADRRQFEEEGEVRNILIDLMKRETANFSADFSNTLVRRLGTSIVAVARPAALGGLQGAEAAAHALGAGRTRLHEQPRGREAAELAGLAAAGRPRPSRTSVDAVFHQADGEGTLKSRPLHV